MSAAPKSPFVRNYAAEAQLPVLADFGAALERLCKSIDEVTHSPNALDRCDACNAKDHFGTFHHTFQNGREIALCDECK